MIAGIKVTYASIPATLSVSPEAAVAGKTAARPLHAAHTVAPSATCAPHILQNAIGVSPPFLVEVARTRPSDVAAKYQKAAREAINNLPRLPRPNLNSRRFSASQSHPPMAV